MADRVSDTPSASIPSAYRLPDALHDSGLHRIRIDICTDVDMCRAMAGTTHDNGAILHRFQAIAEETRFRIIQFLARGERCVCDIQDELGAAQPRLSFHLRKLKEAGLVVDRREGRWVYYSLVPESIDEVLVFLGGVKPDPEQCGTRC